MVKDGTHSLMFFVRFAGQLDYVIGVDPHRDSHAIGVVEVRTGGVVFEASVVADSGGYAEATCCLKRYLARRIYRLLQKTPITT